MNGCCEAVIIRRRSATGFKKRKMEHRMVRLGTTSILVLVFFALPALAAEMPSRKAGLWEVKTSFDGGNMPAVVIRQCVDAATDQMMQSGAGPNSQRDCSKRDVQKSGDSITIDSTCTIAGKSRTAHAVITGSFDSAYTMTMTSQGDGTTGAGKTMTMAAKWIGPCAADQKPGDTIMPNGMKFNVMNAGKLAAPQLTSPPPGK
jgi:Protein of unknown function (DUF3617)